MATMFDFAEKMSRQGGRVTDTKKVSGELFALTYGALVAQILKVRFIEVLTFIIDTQ